MSVSRTSSVTSLDAASTCARQREAFYSLFQNGTFFRPTLDHQIKGGSYDRLGLDSAAWKFYLIVLPELNFANISAPDDWMRILGDKRRQYARLTEMFTTIAPADDEIDPLKKSENPRWSQYFRDSAVREEIKRDTDRLFQDVPFFQDPSIQSKCLDIIFFHLRQFPRFTYMQGFHELLGVIFYLFTKEMRSDPPEMDDAFGFLFDRRYIDADVFWVYSAIVDFLEPFYRPPSGDQMSFVQDKCAEIQDRLLPATDPELADCLRDVGVEGIQYLIPWLRLMFGRIFSLDVTVRVWSCIFAFFPNPKIIDVVAITLVGLFRGDILADPSQCSVLQILMRPRPPNVDKLLERAVAAMAGSGTKSNTKTEPICVEMQTLIDHIFDISSSDIISGLKVFRDVLLSVGMASRKGKDGTEDVASMLGGNLERAPDAPEEAPVVMPKAGAVKGGVDTSILTEEADERGRKRDLFAAKPAADLFG
jgi:hypothetical protein